MIEITVRKEEADVISLYLAAVEIPVDRTNAGDYSNLKIRVTREAQDFLAHNFMKKLEIYTKSIAQKFI